MVVRLFGKFRTEFEIPAGTHTDFASIPASARTFININGRHRLPAVLHDYLYAQGGRIGDFEYTRKDADELFRDAMKDYGVSLVRRGAMYRAVRMFGGLHWG